MSVSARSISTLLLLLISTVLADWPREIPVGKSTVIVYQPQPEHLKGNMLSVIAAVAISQPGKDLIFGAVWVKAKIRTDRDTRKVTMDRMKVTKVKFSAIGGSGVAKLKRTLEENIPKWEFDVTMDDILVSQEKREKGTDVIFDDTPPKIVVSNKPAVLVSIDGEPILEEIRGTGFMRITNTPFFMVFDKASKKYYLQTGSIWRSAADIKGPWKNEYASAELKKIEQKADTGSNAKAESELQVFVETVPAELIVIDGKAKFSPIGGTNLFYLINTESDIFLDGDARKLYILLGGRWFTRDEKGTEVKYIKSTDLPKAFRQIESGSVKASVRAHIDGTKESNEAVMDTYIPQTARLKRGNGELDIRYDDGKPVFEPIADIGVDYAVNTPYAIFRVKGKYYCCENGVWYIASSPTGPWITAISVPDEIYNIPPNHPHYNVTFVRIYEYDNETVECGYTPGYVGCYRYHGCVVYGTGHRYYRCYRRYYYPCHRSWGFHVHYNPHTGHWGFGFWVSGCHGWFYRYHSGGPRPTPYGRWWGPAGYPSLLGNSPKMRIRDMSRSDLRNRINNIYKRKGKLPKMTPRIATNDRKIQLPKERARNNVYADRDGNIYRRRDGDWYRHNGKNWVKTKPTQRPSQPTTRPSKPTTRPSKPAKPTTRPTTRPSAPSTRDVQREYQNRQRAIQRSNRHRSYSRPTPSRTPTRTPSRTPSRAPAPRR